MYPSSLAFKNKIKIKLKIPETSPRLLRFCEGNNGSGLSCHEIIFGLEKWFSS